MNTDSLIRAVAAAPRVEPREVLATVIAARAPRADDVPRLRAALDDLSSTVGEVGDRVLAAVVTSGELERDAAMRATRCATALIDSIAGTQVAVVTDRARDPQAVQALRDSACRLLDVCDDEQPIMLDERTRTIVEVRAKPTTSVAAENMVQRAIAEERLVNVRRLLTLLIPVLVVGWINAIAVARAGAPEVYLVLPALTLWLAVAIVRAWLLHRRPAAARWLMYSVLVVEIPLFFLAQYPNFADSPEPVVVAMFTVAGGANAVVAMQLFMSRVMLVIVAVLMVCGSSTLFAMTGEWWHGMSAALAVGCTVVVALYGQHRARALLRRIVAEVETRARDAEAANVELRRQVANRSRELADALSRLASASPSPARFAAGDVVDDRYRIVRTLGGGGMGKVYEVERTSDGRQLALKVSTRAAAPEALARFAREAQVAAELDHPNLVSIADVGVTAVGTIFIVMELVPGASLATMRARFGDVPWASSVLAQIASALDVMHARSIVHRDLKPANVFVDGARVKVGDFGLAGIIDATPPSSTGAESPPLTHTGAIMGTPFYMAPELAQGARAATPASDIYALGVLAYELISSNLPHSVPPVLERLAGRSPAAPPMLATPGVPAELAALVARCLADDPHARPTASEFLRVAISGSGLT